MWLLAAEFGARLTQFERAGMLPTPAAQLEFEAQFNEVDGDGPRLLTISGDNATIKISGALTNKPSLFAYYLGGGNATYPDIISALAIADADPKVTNIDLEIDSPGGTIAGLFPAIEAIKNTKTTTRAVVANMAGSAAFALATAAGTIQATNPAASFGSVGIVVRGMVFPEDVTITSTDAPKKAPDISTEEGKAIVRAELDEIHELFADAIADGRGTTAKKVNADFGQGAMILAEKAVTLGMIDGFTGVPSLALASVSNTPTANSGDDNQPEQPMDLNELKAKHPSIYAQVIALGEAEGITKERSRVSAFLTGGEKSGAMAKAIGHIRKGDEMSMDVTMEFMMLATDNKDLGNRQDDDDDAAAANGAETEAERDKNASAAILKLANELVGNEVEA